MTTNKQAARRMSKSLRFAVRLFFTGPWLSNGGRFVAAQRIPDIRPTTKPNFSLRHLDHPCPNVYIAKIVLNFSPHSSLGHQGFAMEQKKSKTIIGERRPGPLQLAKKLSPARSAHLWVSPAGPPVFGLFHFRV